MKLLKQKEFGINFGYDGREGGWIEDYLDFNSACSHLIDKNFDDKWDENYWLTKLSKSCHLCMAFIKDPETVEDIEAQCFGIVSSHFVEDEDIQDIFNRVSFYVAKKITKPYSEKLEEIQIVLKRKGE